MGAGNRYARMFRKHHSKYGSYKVKDEERSGRELVEIWL